MITEVRPSSQSSTWRLSHILKGHSSDVKSVRTSSLKEETTSDQCSEFILSASRDETGRLWCRTLTSSASTSELASSPPRYEPTEGFSERCIFKGNRYANSVAALAPCEEAPEGQFILGSLDSVTRVFLSSSSPNQPPKLLQELTSHYDNVSCIAISQYPSNSSLVSTQTTSKHPSFPISSIRAPIMITGSWDQTARVYSLLRSTKTEGFKFEWQEKILLKGHKSAVWGVAIANREASEFLTSSADLFIRLFKGEECVRMFTGHTDVVRGIILMRAPSDCQSVDFAKEPSLEPSEPLFLTCSNDATLQLHSLSNSRIERPDRVPENGGLPIRTLKGSESLVYESCWMGEDLNVGSCGEDGCLRIWDCDMELQLDVIPQPVISVWSLAYLPLSGDLVTGSSDGSIRVYTRRTRAQDVEALGEVSEEEVEEHQKMCDEVRNAKNGPRSEIVTSDSSVTSTSGKQLHSDGLEYDSILQIDVSDDSPALKLPLNKGDDPVALAQGFIQENSLPESYEKEIIQFIEMVGPK